MEESREQFVSWEEASKAGNKTLSDSFCTRANPELFSWLFTMARALGHAAETAI